MSDAIERAMLEVLRAPEAIETPLEKQALLFGYVFGVVIGLFLGIGATLLHLWLL